MMIEYRGYAIEREYVGNRFEVFFEGDDVVFDTVEDAKKFINEVSE